MLTRLFRELPERGASIRLGDGRRCAGSRAVRLLPVRRLSVVPGKEDLRSAQHKARDTVRRQFVAVAAKPIPAGQRAGILQSCCSSFPYSTPC